MYTKTINQQTELIAQNMFNVQTKKSLTQVRLAELKGVIVNTVKTTWIDMKQLDDVTVSIMLETTDNVDDVSLTIADIIQKGSITK